VRLVANYIDGNPERLRVAYAAKQAWPQVSRQIAIAFLNELERTLQAELGKNWRTTNPQDRVFTRWNAFHLYKEHWANRHYIALHPEYSEGRGFSMGVMKKGEDVPRIAGLAKLESLAETYHGNLNRDEWEWCGNVRQEYVDWDNLEALEKLQEKSEALEYFVDYFIRIKDQCEGIIDDGYPNGPGS